jgi:membrane protein involved in colicin uptake
MTTQVAEGMELDTFKPLKAEIARTVEPTLQIKVVDPATSTSAIETAKTIKELLKRLDEKRREITDPIREELDQVNAYVREIREPLEKAEQHIRDQLNGYAREQERIRQEELRKAEEIRRREEAELRAKQAAELEAAKAAAAVFGEDPEAVKAEVEEKHKAERVTAVVAHGARVYDANETQIRNTRRNAFVKIVDLSQVPRDYLVLNEKMALAAMKAGVKIPGLELDYEVSVAIGSKTRAGRRMA